MRKIILFITLFWPGGLNGRATEQSTNFYADRGFTTGLCFRHPAIRRCLDEKAKVRCHLELFPDTHGTLSLPLGAADGALIAGRATTDYGIFTFKVEATRHPAAPQARILKIMRVPLDEWGASQDRDFHARPVSCAHSATRN